MSSYVVAVAAKDVVTAITLDAVAGEVTEGEVGSVETSISEWS